MSSENHRLEESIEVYVRKQLTSQRVGYLLGAGSSYLDGFGYPLAGGLWDLIKSRIYDNSVREAIQAKLDDGATGLEHALDLLDDGGSQDTPYRHEVTEAIAQEFVTIKPPIENHAQFLARLSKREESFAKIFSLNYDPLVERAAEYARVRLSDGFLGAEHAFFEPAVFGEQIGRARGSFKGRRFSITARPIQLFKLHGSLGWYESSSTGPRRTSYDSPIPSGTKRLMVPPQRRKAVDTMLPPYSALWSDFRGCLGHDERPINRLVCVGYGFADEHVNTVIEAALVRSDFTLLVLTKELTDEAWKRWSSKTNVAIITKSRSSLRGTASPGHPELWQFERLIKEI